jgi:signal transduction histidine kinase
MTFEDNGVGITKEDQTKVFTDYTRLQEHNKLNLKGTGLGLSICKDLIEQMGGKVEIDSVKDKYCKFIIT